MYHHTLLLPLYALYNYGQGPMWLHTVSEVSCVHVTKFHFYLFILNVCVFFAAEMLAVT